MAVTYVMVARLPEGGVATFDAYERAVLPLMADHRGRIERRLRTWDDRVEVHVVSFASDDDFAAYRTDPRRHGSAPLLAASGAEIELLSVRDVSS